MTDTTNNRPVSDVMKTHAVLKLARLFGVRTLVETGTLDGRMVIATRGWFEEAHTIELSQYHYELSQRRLKGIPNVVRYQGDSADVLEIILPEIHKPVVYWLDAHYSGDNTAQGKDLSPLSRELPHICKRLATYDDIILIDDACDMGDQHGYLSLESIAKRIWSVRPDYDIEVDKNIIRSHPCLKTQSMS